MKQLFYFVIILLSGLQIHSQTVTTVAGSGTPGSLDGIGIAATFNTPHGLAVDASGNIYVADTYNHCIRKITPSGLVSTFAGTTTAGYVNATGNNAQFYNPRAIAIDASGNLFVADRNNRVIRKITATGVVSTFAGSGSIGSTDGIVDNELFIYTTN